MRTGGGIGRRPGFRYPYPSDVEVQVLSRALGNWRSGSAAPLHGDGHWFESGISHGLKYVMENITFSDSITFKPGGGISIAGNAKAILTLDNETYTLSLEDYCKKNPSALECRESDV